MSDSLHGKRAAELFLSGYNCAQSVFSAFSDITGIPEEDGAKLMSAFGGGMCATRNVCGAVSGMLALLGLLRGYSDPTDHEAKKALYAEGQLLIKKFKDKLGSTECRELLAGIPTGSVPSERSAEYYKVRPCAAFCAEAAMILEEHLAEHE